MIALPYKETPKSWRGVYCAACMNLIISVINLGMGNIISAFISVVFAGAILYYIKHKVQQEIWAKLSRKETSSG